MLASRKTRHVVSLKRQDHLQVGGSNGPLRRGLCRGGIKKKTNVYPADDDVWSSGGKSWNRHVEGGTQRHYQEFKIFRREDQY